MALGIWVRYQLFCLLVPSLLCLSREKDQKWHCSRGLGVNEDVTSLLYLHSSREIISFNFYHKLICNFIDADWKLLICCKGKRLGMCINVNNGGLVGCLFRHQRQGKKGIFVADAVSATSSFTDACPNGGTLLQGKKKMTLWRAFEME